MTQSKVEPGESRVSGVLVVVVVAVLALGVGALTFFYLKREDVQPIPVPASQPR